MSRAGYLCPEPDPVRPGAWAHVRHNTRQHFVAAEHQGRVRLACGKWTTAYAVWHDAPKPHLPLCGTCVRADEARA